MSLVGVVQVAYKYGLANLYSEEPQDGDELTTGGLMFSTGIVF